MAIYWPIANGNWSTVSNWATADGSFITITGSTSSVAGSLPTSTDDILLNNRSVTVDGNFGVSRVTNLSALGAFGSTGLGGRIFLNENSSLSASVFNVFNTTSNIPLISFLSAAPFSASVFGTLSTFPFQTLATNVGNFHGARNFSTGTLNIYGDIIHFLSNTSGFFRGFISNINQGTLNIYGNLFGAKFFAHNSGLGGYSLVELTNGCTCNIYGNVYGPDYASNGSNWVTVFCGYNSLFTVTPLPIQLTIYGSVYNAYGSNSFSNGNGNTIRVTGPSDIFISGSVFSDFSGSGNNRAIVVANSFGTVNINVLGTIFGSSNNTRNCIDNSSSITNLSAGRIIGGSANSLTVNHAAGTLNVYGDVEGGSGSASYAIQNSSGNNVNIFGNCRGGIGAPAVANSSTINRGALFIKRAIGNNFGRGTTGINSVAGVTNLNFYNSVFVQELQSGIRGQFPTQGNIYVQNIPTSNASFFSLLSTNEPYLPSFYPFPNTSYIRAVSSNSNYSTVLSGITGFNNLFTANSSIFGTSLLPSVSNVRLNVRYNFNNNLGTIIIPISAVVKVGVPVDNTVGSAINDPSLVWVAPFSLFQNNNTSLGFRVINSPMLADMEALTKLN